MIKINSMKKFREMKRTKEGEKELEMNFLIHVIEAINKREEYNK